MRSRKPNLIELALVALLALAVGFVAGSYQPLPIQRAIALGMEGAAEVQPLADRFGERRSRFAEEWIVRDFFNDSKGGVFVDIGSADPQFESNTYFLETSLGWSGIAVDAQAQYAERYRALRPRTTFFALLPPSPGP